MAFAAGAGLLEAAVGEAAAECGGGEGLFAAGFGPFCVGGVEVGGAFFAAGRGGSGRR